MNKKPTEPRIYQIKLQGYLNPEWHAWFEGVTIDHDDEDNTRLTGVIDQSALHGLLRKIRDIGAILISIECHHNYPPTPTD
jgi:hypothetical protein